VGLAAASCAAVCRIQRAAQIKQILLGIGLPQINGDFLYAARFFHGFFCHTHSTAGLRPSKQREPEAHLSGTRSALRLYARFSWGLFPPAFVLPDTGLYVNTINKKNIKKYSGTLLQAALAVFSVFCLRVPFPPPCQRKKE
jgi:hypothetical protein